MAYTTSATSKGGREGRVALDSGGMALAMSFPKELGGAGDAMNPEQLFAMGYASCFNQAIIALGRQHGIDPASAKLNCKVTLNKGDDGFSLAVDLSLSVPGADREKAQALLEAAHQVCPYSKATRGNVPVTLTLA